MEISRDCKDFLASFDLGTSCRRVSKNGPGDSYWWGTNHAQALLMIFLPGICLFPFDLLCVCRFRLMEIQLNIWNASTWQCWWFTTWRCRWSERRTDGWTLVLAPCNANKEIGCISIPKSPTEPNFDFVLTIPLIEFKNPRSDFWHHNFQAENLELLHSEPRILRVLLEVGPVSKECWWRKRWEVLDDGNWKKVTERKKEARDGMTKASLNVVKVYISLWDVSLWNFWK